MYRTAVYQGGRVEFAPYEGVEQPEFPNDEGRESAPTLRDAEDDQLSKKRTMTTHPTTTLKNFQWNRKVMYFS